MLLLLLFIFVIIIVQIDRLEVLNMLVVVLFQALLVSVVVLGGVFGLQSGWHGFRLLT